MGWFAVRHVIQNVASFEERITLWDASSADDAIAKAELEATEYVGLLGEPYKVLDLFQSFEMFEPPGDGLEAFSLIRDSELSADEYVDSFFATGAEYERKG
jgi:hypothetical protein